MSTRIKYFKLEQDQEASEFIASHFLSGGKSLNIGQNGIVVQYEDERGLSLSDKISTLLSNLRDAESQGLVYEVSIAKELEKGKFFEDGIEEMKKKVADLTEKKNSLGKDEAVAKGKLKQEIEVIEKMLGVYENQLKSSKNIYFTTSSEAESNRLNIIALAKVIEKYEKNFFNVRESQPRESTEKTN